MTKACLLTKFTYEVAMLHIRHIRTASGRQLICVINPLSSTSFYTHIPSNFNA